LKKHFTAIIFLMLYTWLVTKILRSQLKSYQQIKAHPHGADIIGYGEFVAYSDIFLLVIGVVFLLVSCGFAIDNREKNQILFIGKPYYTHRNGCCLNLRVVN
jgi:hypothetical protein